LSSGFTLLRAAFYVSFVQVAKVAVAITMKIFASLPGLCYYPAALTLPGFPEAGFCSQNDYVTFGG
jgi:hypothetical protein